MAHTRRIAPSVAPSPIRNTQYEILSPAPLPQELPFPTITLPVEVLVVCYGGFYFLFLLLLKNLGALKL